MRVICGFPSRKIFDSVSDVFVIAGVFTPGLSQFVKPHRTSVVTHKVYSGTTMAAFAWTAKIRLVAQGETLFCGLNELSEAAKTVRVPPAMSFPAPTT